MRKIAIVLIFISIASYAEEIVLAPNAVVPEQYINDEFAPNGQPERVRYVLGYENFWWMCIQAKSENLEVRCEHICSGTAAATDGCWDGADAAEEATSKLVKHLGSQKAKEKFKSLLCTEGHIKGANSYGNNIEELCKNGI